MAPDQYDEVEGIFPDGQYTCVECRGNTRIHRLGRQAGSTRASGLEKVSGPFSLAEASRGCYAARHGKTTPSRSGRLCVSCAQPGQCALTDLQKDGDYDAFGRIAAATLAHVPSMRLLAYCLMPNHWHLLLWPRRDGQLAAFVHWLTLTHTQRWHAHYHDVGSGHLYQGRYQSFPVQRGRALLRRLPLRRAQRPADRFGQAGRGVAVGQSVAPRSGRPHRAGPVERLASGPARGLGP
jgi:hypothetical protein